MAKIADSVDINEETGVASDSSSSCSSSSSSSSSSDESSASESESDSVSDSEEERQRDKHDNRAKRYSILLVLQNFTIARKSIFHHHRFIL